MSVSDPFLEKAHATLVELARSLALARGDFEASLRELTEATARALGVMRSSIWLYTPEKDGIRLLDLYEADSGKHSSDAVLHKKDYGPYFAALEGERTIAAHDARSDPRTSSLSPVYLAPLGISSMLDAPIRHGGRMVGVVCQEHIGPARRWTDAEQQFAGSIGDFLALALEARDRRKAEQELARRVEALARSNAELEQYAHLASHDLQEPLRMVSSYVGLLEKRYRGKLDADADKYIRYAVDGVKRMHLLIEDLLAFSLAGQIPSNELAMLDLGEVTAAVIQDLQWAIEDTSAKVTVKPLPTVRAHRTQLARVIQNLIGNALKYHGEQPPLVEVSAEPVGEAWQVSVRDHGIGIEPRHFDKIFRLFQRLHDRQKYEGTGIGLAIAKRIVEAHGGRIWVESTPGAGSTFTFTLSRATGSDT